MGMCVCVCVCMLMYTWSIFGDRPIDGWTDRWTNARVRARAHTHTHTLLPVLFHQTAQSFGPQVQSSLLGMIHMKCDLPWCLLFICLFIYWSARQTLLAKLCLSARLSAWLPQAIPPALVLTPTARFWPLSLLLSSPCSIDAKTRNEWLWL